RLYSDMALEDYYLPANSPLSADFAAPDIHRISSQLTPTGADFLVDVGDSSGVARVLLTYNVPNGQGGTWRSLDLHPGATGLLWTGSLSGAGLSTQYFVQALDLAGNVAVEDNRGAYFNAGVSHADVVNPLGVPHTFSVTVDVDNGDGQGFVPAPNGTTGL